MTITFYRTEGSQRRIGIDAEVWPRMNGGKGLWVGVWLYFVFVQFLSK